jgi:hypothetical protein
VTGPKPALDLSTLAFPSDAISIRHLRKLFPKEFDDFEDIASMPFLNRDDGVAGFVNEIVFLERELAIKAYQVAKAVGRGKSFSTNTDWEEEKRRETADLIRLYQVAGLSAGQFQATQQIQAFSEAAAAQATQEVSGRSPPQQR